MIFLIPIFFVIALIYSVAGLAGGSSYLALLSWCGMSRNSLVVTALLCNAVVSAQGTYSYYKAGLFRPKLFWPLAVASIPFAFLGGLTPISDPSFHFLLGLSLLLAALHLLFPKSHPTEEVFPEKMFWLLGPLTGAVLGFLAGLVGLGGGIFLGPVLILSGVADAKETAAITAPFIFVNSMSGLAAHSPQIHSSLFLTSLPLLLAVAVGGRLGSSFGVRRLQPIWVQRAAAVLLSLVGFKLLGRGG